MKKVFLTNCAAALCAFMFFNASAYKSCTSEQVLFLLVHWWEPLSKIDLLSQPLVQDRLDRLIMTRRGFGEEFVSALSGIEPRAFWILDRGGIFYHGAIAPFPKTDFISYSTVYTIN